MHYVYIIHSNKLNKFYIGKTADLKRRLYEHNIGVCDFTTKGRPWLLIHYQAFLEENDASREELFLKTGKGRERRKYLLKSYLEKRVVYAQGGVSA